MRWKNCILLLVSVLSASSAVFARKPEQRMTRQEYIARYAPLAVEHQKIYGIPASIKLAQGLLESGDGNSRLACESNNHFGIKCKTDWRGPVVFHDDDEAGECFRAYPTVEESYADHSLFLRGSKRYEALFKLKTTDYKGWARGLKAAGYATNPRYAEILIGIIEDNQLYYYDRGMVPLPAVGGAENFASAAIGGSLMEGRVDLNDYTAPLSAVAGRGVFINNSARYVTAVTGDTYESLGRLLGIPARRLRRYNDAAGASALRPGDVVYIDRKGRRGSAPSGIHRTDGSESMLDVSQRYGVRYGSLRALNKSLRVRDASVPLAAGTEIKLM